MAVVAAVASVCLTGPAAPAGALELKPGTEYVNVTADDVKGDDISEWPAISADGRYVAFWSYASNLVPGDTDTAGDVYVKDLRTGRIHWAGDVPEGMEREGAFGSPSISADGRRVAFATLDGRHAYVHDLRTGRTEPVDDGVTASFDMANLPVISGNGRYVTFAATAPALGSRVYLRDLVSGTGEWIDHPLPSGRQELRSPTLSRDGRYLAYTVSGDDSSPGESTAVHVLDRHTGQRVRADVDCAGDPAESHVGSPVISADGRQVVFRMKCLTLLPEGTNDTGDVFVRDLRRGTLQRVVGPRPEFGTHSGRLSADGRHLVFAVVEEEAHRPYQVIYARDLRTGRTVMVTARPDGTPNRRPAARPSIDAHGRTVAYDAIPGDLLGEAHPVGERQALVTHLR
ncbi:hypothetical protein GCM10010129_01800 [Streptomyces fumigatiscleroticus]|nr:hypothetical protein GCM10010129_01800 [Streptomyces fumigatiscleroticus]